MKIEKIPNTEPNPESSVQLKKTGNIFEIRTMSKAPQMPIKKLDRDNFVNIKTGEVKGFKHTEKRTDNIKSVSQSLKQIRNYINTNITKPEKALFVTLTYAENMQDTERLYNDFRKFNMKLKYYLNKNKMPKYEYILVIEPQARGSLHAHLLLIFNEKAPFIPNNILAEIWGHGFVKIKSLKNIDNIGAYLSAYLGDMELGEALTVSSKEVKGFKLIKNDKKPSKAIVKGARLKLYPKGFRIFRKSKGIVPPEITDCTYSEAMHEIGNCALTYEKTIKISDDNGKTCNIINYRHYNKNRNNGGVPDKR